MPRPMQTILKTGVAYSDYQRPVEMTLYDENHQPINIAEGGVQGPEGPEGPEGPQGPAGEDGADGAAGPNTLPPVEGFIGRVANGANPFAGAYGWMAVAMAGVLDTGDTHVGGAPAQWTVHRTGWFWVTAACVFQNAAAGFRGALVVDTSNANSVVAAVLGPSVVGEVTALATTRMVYLTQGHVLEYRAQQNTAAIVPHYADGVLASGMELIYAGT